MITEIKTITGSCHKLSVGKPFVLEHGDAELYLTRFFNRISKDSQIQLTVRQLVGSYYTSYIHLSKEQCEELSKVLLECFDYEKYPSE